MKNPLEKQKNNKIPPRPFNLNSRGRTKNKNKMKPDFLNPSPFDECESQLEKAVPSDGFFVLQKPNCYLQDGMLQTDFVAYNLSLEDITLTEEVMYKLNVCPSHVLQTFQAIETQMHNIKPLVEQEFEQEIA